jgi:hypothetical protein
VAGSEDYLTYRARPIVADKRHPEIPEGSRTYTRGHTRCARPVFIWRHRPLSNLPSKQI